jgi:tetratricopeptide (TPR) repeat protein
MLVLAVLGVLLTLLGFFAFVFGIVAEVFTRRPEASAGFSPNIGVALAGLVLAGVSAAVLFGLIAVFIARQGRLRGAPYMDAYRLLESLRFREAIPLLEKLVRDGKADNDVLMLLTSAYGYAGQYANAQATADRAVQLYPDDPRSYVTLSTGYKLQGAYDEAATALRAALVKDPAQASLWAELGFVLRFAGDEGGALEAFRHAAAQPLPALYGVRVNYHLSRALSAGGAIEDAVRAAARMMAARDGLGVWRSVLPALSGTAYGTALRYELSDIERALADADAANLG